MPFYRVHVAQSGSVVSRCTDRPSSCYLSVLVVSYGPIVEPDKYLSGIQSQATANYIILSTKISGGSV